MARNGSGTYQLPAGNPVVPSTVISSTWANTTLSDIGTALTQSIANDGQTTPVANLPMATFRHTNVGNAVARNEYAAAGQVQDSSLQWLTAVAGTDTITASIAPGPAAYTAGQTFRFLSAGANTTAAVTLNINGLGAKNLTKFSAQPLNAGDIASSQIVTVVYDGTQFQAQDINVSRGPYSVRGLIGANNSGAPTTSFDLLANVVAVRNPTTGEVVTRTNVSSITNNVSTVGPAANGRDQAGAFSASSWIHFYFIWNGTTMATVSSATAPPTGPTLPTGYTHWAYAGAIFFTAGSQLSPTYIRGSWARYSGSPQPVSTTSTPTVATAVSMAAFIPPNCLSYHLYTVGTVTAGGGGPVAASLTFQAAASSTIQSASITAHTSTIGAVNVQTTIPNISNQFLYVWGTVTNISSAAYGIFIDSYQMPNGGE